MFSTLIRRGEELARAAQAREILLFAQHLEELFGEGAVDVEEARLLVRGRGIIKRWLIDPSLRFLAGGFR
jgi:hypothetical protein